MGALQIFTGILIACLMLGVGSTLKLEDLKASIKQPKPILIGFFSQNLLMPLISFAFAIVLAPSNPIAVSMIVIGCTPGGSTSNLFSLWSFADVALSITMTCCSTLLSVCTMPVLLLVLTPRFVDEEFDIPYLNILTTLGIALGPALIGVYIRHKSVKWAKRVERTGGIVGAIFIAVAMVFGAITHPEVFNNPWQVWVAGTSLFFVGAAFGYGTAALGKLPSAQRRTVAFETGVQNAGLSIAILTFSFESDTELLKEVLLYPFCYAVLVYLDSALLIFFFRWRVQRERKKKALEAAEKAIVDGGPHVLLEEEEDVSGDVEENEEGVEEEEDEAGEEEEEGEVCVEVTIEDPPAATEKRCTTPLTANAKQATYDSVETRE